MDQVVVVGGGHAGVEFVTQLRLQGFEGQVTVLEAESETPYQRPPLSKDFIFKDPSSAQPVLLKSPEFFSDNNVDFRAGVNVLSVDCVAQTVQTDEGESVHYDTLVFATGAAGRALTVDGAELDGVVSIRTLADARDLAKMLPDVEDVVVIGAGFIGLEFAAGVAAEGKSIQVLEFAEKPLMRALSTEMSDYFVRKLPQLGVQVRYSTSVERLIGDEGKVTAVELTTGEILKADLVVVGIGVTPNAQLAEKAGLAVANGITVDEFLQTSDEHVFAIGDCANFPSIHAGGPLRLESVQNATDQARFLAKRLVAAEAPEGGYAELPWFWSQQGVIRLSIAGLNRPNLQTVILGDVEDDKFSIFAFDGEELVVVESINSPADHMNARKLLGAGVAPTRAQVEADGFSLKAFAAEVFAAK